jgi:hypothetical protein
LEAIQCDVLVSQAFAFECNLYRYAAATTAALSHATTELAAVKERLQSTHEEKEAVRKDLAEAKRLLTRSKAAGAMAHGGGCNKARIQLTHSLKPPGVIP